MMAFRVARPCNPYRLIADLEAAGIQVITVRGARAPGDALDLAAFAVVVTSDAADLGAANAVIAAHLEPRIPSRTPTAAERNRSLSEMEKV